MNKEILVYSKTDCPYAPMMKKWFKDKKIKFTEIEITDIIEIPKDQLVLGDKLPLLVINKKPIGSYMDLIRQENYIKYLVGLIDLEEI